MDQLRTPVALICFNRPDLTEKVLCKLREQRPETFFVIADGPRANVPSDEENCQSVRALIEKLVDWPCQLHRVYSETNMGCRDRVVSGLDVVFSKVNESIVIEDDCLPSDSFFPFAAEILDRYRDDQRVFTVTGNNHSKIEIPNGCSYYFSRYPHIWGWGTWKRVWSLYDKNLRSWKAGQFDLSDRYLTLATRDFFNRCFTYVESGKINTWDYQLVNLCLRYNGFTVVPESNLVKNIGFDERATHTKSVDSKFAAMLANEIATPLRHPVDVELYDRGDLIVETEIFCNRSKSLSRKVLRFILNNILRLGR